MNTGTCRSVRIRRVAGAPVDVMERPFSGAPLPPRLWMKIPSKVWLSGSSVSANVVR